ncbi:NHL repeat-containing protein [Streptomyces phaeochromogenes]|uniref:hypothetical protein n=1 Tax=Streptomyces phaeochromogenes TaxID=1923 RepID=UPI00371D1DB1
MSSEIVAARLEPHGNGQPAWAPWQTWADGTYIYVHDKATCTVHGAKISAALRGAPLTVRPTEGPGPWWRDRLGKPAADALEKWLDARGSERPPVGAVTIGPKGWLVAVNHPLDADHCRIVVGDDTGISRTLVLPLETARSIAGIAWGPNDDIVVVDNYLHVCVSLSASGAVRWSFGAPRTPGPDDELLSSPSECLVIGAETWVINEMSGTITLLDRAGQRLSVLRRDAPGLDLLPKTPTGAVALSDDQVVVTDAHSGLLHTLSRGPEGWRCRTLVTNQHASPVGGLSFPRGLAARGDTLLVADTANQRVAALSIGKRTIVDVLHIGGWPRTLAVSKDGLLVADGLGSRLVRVELADDSGGPVLADARVTDLVLTYEERPVTLEDPHHLVAAGADRYWLTDSDLNDVLLLDTTGRIHRRWSASPAGAAYPLSDPHQVEPVDGGILVVDTNNDRILYADEGLAEASVVAIALTRPRFIVRYGDGWLVSDHTGRLAAFTAHWEQEGSFTIRPEGLERSVHLDDPPRGLLAHQGAVYATDWERGLVYRIT